MNKKLEITTATVTIQLVTVDGKKMTKAVFNQVQEENCLNDRCEFIGDSLLGYVLLENKWLLWIKDGELRKHNLVRLEEILRVNIDTIQSLNFLKPYFKLLQIDTTEIERGYYFNRSPICQFIPSEVNLKLKIYQNDAERFLDKVCGKQLYIAI